MANIIHQVINLPKNLFIEIPINCNIIKIYGKYGLLIIRFTTFYACVIDFFSSLLIKFVNHSHRTPSYWNFLHRTIKNALNDVTHGYSTCLQLIGLGFRFHLTSTIITMKIGFTYLVQLLRPINLQLQLKPTNVLEIISANRHEVQLFASIIRQIRPISPYKLKGIKFETDLICLKEGKKTK